MHRRRLVLAVLALLAATAPSCGAPAEHPRTPAAEPPARVEPPAPAVPAPPRVEVEPDAGPAAAPTALEVVSSFSVEVQSDSTLGADVVREVVGTRRAGFRRCAEAFVVAMSTPSSGALPLRYLIGPGGNVISVNVLGPSTPDPTFLQCVLDQSDAFVFPPGSGNTVFVLTLDYGPRP
jgi:hypothetical protein